MLVVERVESLAKRVMLSLVRKAVKIVVPGLAFLIFKYLSVCLHSTLTCFKKTKSLTVRGMEDFLEL